MQNQGRLFASLFPGVKFIILNTKILVFSTQFIVFNTRFLVLIRNTSLVLTLGRPYSFHAAQRPHCFHISFGISSLASCLAARCTLRACDLPMVRGAPVSEDSTIRAAKETKNGREQQLTCSAGQSRRRHLQSSSFALQKYHFCVTLIHNSSFCVLWIQNLSF